MYIPEGPYSVPKSRAAIWSGIGEMEVYQPESDGYRVACIMKGMLIHCTVLI